jgi:hypothetical protein
MPKLKEPHYFAPNVRPTPRFPYRVVREEAKYLDLFRGSKSDCAIGEASTSYLWDSESPALIADKIPNAKIIMILRDPVERAFSHYLMSYRGGVETLPFYEALIADFNAPERGFGISNLYVELGFYSRAVRQYLELFGNDNVKILIFEEFRERIRELVFDVLRFLHIRSPPPDNLNVTYNAFFTPRNGMVLSVLRNPVVQRLAGSLPPSVINRLRGNRIFFKNTGKPKVEEEARKFLVGIYKDDVAALETVLGRSLPWLKSSS